MNKFLFQIAKPGIFHRWIAVNADDETSARAMIAERYHDYEVVQVRNDG
jgi:hypothetical protein